MMVVGIVAAHDEAATIAGTITAVRAFTDEVVVVDDGSTDRTADEAVAAGARVLRTSHRRGKGTAVEAALQRIEPADIWLFADGDLGSSAGGLGTLVDAVVGGEADLALAVFPAERGGGFGIVKRTAATAIEILTGYRSEEPLSGQRVLTNACLQASRPLARGFGMETAMLIDTARADMRIIEIEVPGLTHRETSRDLIGFAHRGRQGMDIAAALIRRIIKSR